MRRLGPDGTLSEIINWGRRNQMTDEGLDQFVENVPIEPYAPCAVTGLPEADTDNTSPIPITRLMWQIFAQSRGP